MIDGWITCDDFISFSTVLNISVIVGQWKADTEKLCAKTLFMLAKISAVSNNGTRDW